MGLSRREQAKEKEMQLRERRRKEGFKLPAVPDEKGIYLSMLFDYEHGQISRDQIEKLKELHKTYGRKLILWD
jgi:transcriptional regulator with XRE-family HTH domain